MRTIVTIATIQADGTLTVVAPADMAPGTYRMVVVIDEAPLAPPPPPLPTWPPRDYGPWPSDLVLQREALYERWGR